MTDETLTDRIIQRQVSLGLLVGIVLIVLFGIATIALQLSGVIDLSGSVTDIWIWVMAVILGTASGLITRGILQPRNSTTKPQRREISEPAAAPPQSPPRLQGIYGAEELLEVLEALESKGRQWQTLIAGAPQEKDVSLVEREAYSHRGKLLNLSAYYLNAWDATLQNKITIIYRELEHGSGLDPSRMRTLENRYLLRGVGYAS